MKITKPNFLIIGAMKSGTTSLYSILRQHPQIFMPKIKEPMFFNSLKNKNEIVKGTKGSKKIRSLKDYYHLFQNVKNEIAVGEASPSYIYDKNSAKFIKEKIPNVKIIAIIRQPVERAYSNFLHNLRSGKEPILNFNDALKEESNRINNNWSPLYHYKNKGMYFNQLNRYYKLFPKENIHVIIFDDLVKNQAETLKKIYKFLNIDEFFLDEKHTQKNISGIPKGLLGWLVMKARYYNLIMNLEVSRYLPKYAIKIIRKIIYKDPKKINSKEIKELTSIHFKQDILKLEKLINTDLKMWL